MRILHLIPAAEPTQFKFQFSEQLTTKLGHCLMMMTMMMIRDGHFHDHDVNIVKKEPRLQNSQQWSSKSGQLVNNQSRTFNQSFIRSPDFYAVPQTIKQCPVQKEQFCLHLSFVLCCVVLLSILGGTMSRSITDFICPQRTLLPTCIITFFLGLLVMLMQVNCATFKYMMF